MEEHVFISSSAEHRAERNDGCVVAAAEHPAAEVNTNTSAQLASVLSEEAMDTSTLLVPQQTALPLSLTASGAGPAEGQAFVFSKPGPASRKKLVPVRGKETPQIRDAKVVLNPLPIKGGFSCLTTTVQAVGTTTDRDEDVEEGEEDLGTSSSARTTVMTRATRRKNIQAAKRNIRVVSNVQVKPPRTTEEKKVVVFFPDGGSPVPSLPPSTSGEGSIDDSVDLTMDEDEKGTDEEEEAGMLTSTSGFKVPIEAPLERARKRGRPVTTGEYEILKRARTQREQEERERLEADINRTVCERMEEVGITTEVESDDEDAFRVSLSNPNFTYAEGVTKALSLKEAIHTLASKSRNIKGSIQRQFKVAADSFLELHKEVTKRAQNSEKEVAHLSGQVKVLLEENATIRENYNHLLERLTQVEARLAGGAPPPLQESSPPPRRIPSVTRLRFREKGFDGREDASRGQAPIRGQDKDPGGPRRA